MFNFFTHKRLRMLISIAFEIISAQKQRDISLILMKVILPYARDISMNTVNCQFLMDNYCIRVVCGGNELEV